MSKIFVTGGSGFIGKNLLPYLSEQDTVFNFSLSSGYNLLDDAQTCESIAQFSPDIIYNLASHGGSLHYVAKIPADIIHDNITMALNLYKAVKKCRVPPKVVNPISNCSYPGNTFIQKEVDWLNGPTHESVVSFGNSKRVLYHIAECYRKQYGIQSYNLIFPNAFGPCDSTDPNKTHALDGMIIRMIKAKQAKQDEFEIWGSGKPVREWIYSRDFVKYLVVLPTLMSFDTRLVNIGQNRGYTIRESAEIVKKVVGFKGNLVFNTKYQDGDPVKILDNEILQSLFDTPEFVNHEQAIAETVQYYEGVL